MDIRKRLLRRPVLTVLWSAALLAASLLVGVGFSIRFSADRLPAVLDAHHTTIAVQKFQADWNGTTETANLVRLTEEQLARLAALPMVKKIELRTLSGAYSPVLTSKLGLAKWGNECAMHMDSFAPRGMNDSYAHAIVCGTVERAWTVPWRDSIPYDLSLIGGGARMGGAWQCAYIAVDEIAVLHPAYDLFATEAFTGYDGHIVVRFMTYGDSAPYFTVGQRYVVSGNYNPQCHATEGHPGSVPFAPHLTLGYGAYETAALPRGDGLIAYRCPVWDWEAVPYPIVTPEPPAIPLLSVSDAIPVAMPWNETVDKLCERDELWAAWVKEAENSLHSFPVLATDSIESMAGFVQNVAAITEGRTFTPEEIEAGAHVCVIDEEIAKAAGIAVGDTVPLALFPAASAREGNQSIADPAVYGASHPAQSNPSLGVYPLLHGSTDTSPWTVVGLYRLENEWEDSAFAITPNTIFIPKKAQIEGAFGGPSRIVGTQTVTFRLYEGNGTSVEMPEGEEYTIEREITMNEAGTSTQEAPVWDDGGVCGVYLSILLQNGSMDAFKAAIAADEELFGRQFLTFDQGYDAAKDGIEAVQNAATLLWRLLLGGAAALLLLYLILYQGIERRTVGTMRSLGASKGETRRYLFVGGLLLVLLGVIVGTALSGLVTDAVQTRLLSLTLSEADAGAARNFDAFAVMLTESRPALTDRLLLALTQLGVSTAVLWLHAALLSLKNPRRLMGV